MKRPAKSASPRFFLYSEDFVEFFKMMQKTAVFIREHPVPADVKSRQDRKWAKANSSAPPPGRFR